jgi:hypothetical protein
MLDGVRQSSVPPSQGQPLDESLQPAWREINGNLNVDAGNEDQVLTDALYRELIGVFARRIAKRSEQVDM